MEQSDNKNFEWIKIKHILLICFWSLPPESLGFLSQDKQNSTDILFIPRCMRASLSFPFGPNKEAILHLQLLFIRWFVTPLSKHIATTPLVTALAAALYHQQISITTCQNATLTWNFFFRLLILRPSCKSLMRTHKVHEARKSALRRLDQQMG